MSLPEGKPTLSVAPTEADKRSAIGGAWGVSPPGQIHHQQLKQKKDRVLANITKEHE